MKVEEILKSKQNRCPVCGRHVEAFEICKNCGWENDPLQAFDEELENEANKESLKEYKEKYFKKEK